MVGENVLLFRLLLYPFSRPYSPSSYFNEMNEFFYFSNLCLGVDLLELGVLTEFWIARALEISVC